MKQYKITYKNKSYKVLAKDSDTAAQVVVDYVNEVEDDRLSPMTYKKLKEMGYDHEDWKDWTQEHANEVVAKNSNEAPKGSDELSESDIDEVINGVLEQEQPQKSEKVSIENIKPEQVTRDLIINNGGSIKRNGITIEVSSLYNPKTGNYDGGYGNLFSVFGYDVGCPGKQGFRSIASAVAYAKKYGMFKPQKASATKVAVKKSVKSHHPHLGNYTHTEYEYDNQAFSSTDRPESGTMQITETHPYDNTDYNWAKGIYNGDGTITFNLISEGKRVGEPITVKRNGPLDKVFEMIRKSNKSKKAKIDRT